MFRKSVFFFLVITGLVFLLPNQIAAYNLSTIEAPQKREVLDFEPVEVVILLKKTAAPETFRAWLNHKNITDRFHPIPGGMKAFLTPADGLRVFEEDERGSVHSKGSNFLLTKIKGNGWKIDFDFRLFFVKTETVDTERDDKGVWFITGSESVSLYYVFEAMGYAVATDRLWQMELYRRQGSGTLAEIFGPTQLSTDIFIRTIRYSDQELTEAFENLDADSQKVIKGYIAGINRRIAEIRNDPAMLPFEFMAIAQQLQSPFFPADWQPEDILGWMAMLLRNFDPEALDTAQIENAALFQDLMMRFGPAGGGMFEDLRWINDPEAQTYIIEDSTSGMASIASADYSPAAAAIELCQVADTMKERKEAFVSRLKEIKAHVKMGSYAWVVSGDKTESGNPIIYSGPQMGFSVPSIVLEGSIRAAGMEISGMSVPGIPGIIIGRTPHHAWSMQVGHAHTTDYYIENPADVSLHRFETIKVAGLPDVNLPVFRSDHGPIINPMPYDPTSYVPDPTNPIISWKYAHWGYEFDTIRAFLDLAKATSMDEFGAGIEKVGVSQHFCYADRDGNIAYWMSGRNPARPEGEWRVPQGLLAPPLEWDAAMLSPHSTDRNASRGFYTGWNNKTSPDYDNAYNSISDIYGPFHRSHVLYDYFEDNLKVPGNTLSFDELRDLALLIASTDSFGSGGNPWKFVADDFTAFVTQAGPTPEQQEALDLLSAWDGHFVVGGPANWAMGDDRADAWILMDQWIKEVLRLTFHDELGNSQSDRLLMNVLLHGLAGDDSAIINHYDWFTNAADPTAPQTAANIVVAALDNTLAMLGDQPWGIGARGAIPFEHLLPPIGEIHAMPFASRSTYAHCVEYSPEGPVRIESMFPLGESGTILMGAEGQPVFDPNFFSMVPVYDYFVYRNFPLFD